MPIRGIYTWTEKRDSLQLLIPLKGVAPSKVDILATSSTLKVNFAPYLIDIVLNGRIDSLRHKARVKDGSLHLTLFKSQPGVWGDLELGDNDADAKEKVRSEAVQSQKELDEQLNERRKERRIADERFSTKKQMALEERERTRLDNKKEEEKAAAEEEVYSSFAKMQTQAAEEEKSRARVSQSAHSAPISITGAAAVPKSGHGLGATYDLKDGDIDSDLEDSKDVGLDVIDEEEPVELYSSNYEHEDCHLSHSQSQATADEDADIKYIPPPRAAAGTASVGINFTPRVFPTPMRESKQAEEQDWIAKNRKHLKKHGQLGQNLTKGNGVDISEEDPSWLKAKGDDFFRGGDFRSAVNAYSSALDVDDKMISCYSNRSACYLKLGAPADCRSDCTDAIEIVNGNLESGEMDHDDVALSRKTLAKLLMRRGISNCQLGNYGGAISDYESAITTLTVLGAPESAVSSARSDLEKLSLLQVADVAKKRGDEAMAKGDIAQAIEQYSLALQSTPMHVGCLSNRAAGKLALRDFEGCVSDCSAALSVLEEDEAGEKIASGAGSDSLSMLTAILPPKGSDKRKSWHLKTLVRRGAAHAQAKDIDAAIVDYGRAVAMDPADTTLKEDLNKLSNFRAGLRSGGAKLQ